MNRHNVYIQLVKSSKPTMSITRKLMKERERRENLSSEKSLTYCANLVKQHDYENFLATLLMTKALRSPALVIRAFNVEIARIQDITTDSNTAAFRLQFWQDVLKDIFVKGQILSNIPANPVAQELFKVCCTFNLQRRYLEKLITSRSLILKSKYFRSIEDIERYADDSVSSVYHLLLGVAGVKSVHADHAASHLGKAQGIANILRSVHVSSHHKIISLPMEVLAKHDVSQEQVLRAADSAKMRNVSFEIATRANNHLFKARSITVPKIANQIFLPAAGVHLYLTKLEKRDFNIFHQSLLLGSPTLPFTLYYNRVLNKF